MIISKVSPSNLKIRRRKNFVNTGKSLSQRGKNFRKSTSTRWIYFRITDRATRLFISNDVKDLRTLALHYIYPYFDIRRFFRVFMSSYLRIQLVCALQGFKESIHKEILRDRISFRRGLYEFKLIKLNELQLEFEERRESQKESLLTWSSIFLQLTFSRNI